MSQNRNKLINLFIGNISNSIVHQILEKAVDNDELSNNYNKELLNSLNIAKKYREKINPVHSQLPDKDILYIKTKITNRVRSELLMRISRGYENIDLELVEGLVDKALKVTYII
tara:strand:- start:165 stop:506 length:342 start_codon:yes stop_codon:yes gene_type:complete